MKKMKGAELDIVIFHKQSILWSLNIPFSQLLYCVFSVVKTHAYKYLQPSSDGRIIFT